jgi:aminoglycoside 6'-N-acetyltransferase I
MACEIQRSRLTTFAGRDAAERVIVRAVRASDAEAWRQMREQLWPDGRDTHAAEIRQFLDGPASAAGAVLVAERENGLAGFVELSLRRYAEGCETSPVAYLEGWFVSPDARGAGVGRILLAAAEEWGRTQGCTELASDTEAENQPSAETHRACGFTDAGLVRCFRKTI